MKNIDTVAAREIAKSDLLPGFAILMKEKPSKYKFDEKAFLKSKDNEIMGIVEFYSGLVQNGMGWKAASERTYEKARETSLRGCR
jgi:hypothetical protein